MLHYLYHTVSADKVVTIGSVHMLLLNFHGIGVLQPAGNTVIELCQCLGIVVQFQLYFNIWYDCATNINSLCLIIETWNK